MPATLDKPPEVQQREESTGAGRGRQSSAVMLALVILVVTGIAATLIAILALTDDDDHMSSPAHMAGGGAAMMSGGAVGEPSPAGTQTVMVTLGDMWVRPSMSTVKAGKVTFVARNVGAAEHELMVEPMPIKFDKPGQPTEDAAIGMIEEMGHMGTGRMTLQLKPGKYELFCNVSGHYAAGQHTVLTVTS